MYLEMEIELTRIIIKFDDWKPNRLFSDGAVWR